MVLLFFFFTGELLETAQLLFSLLKLPFSEGDSANVLGGDYYVARLLGFRIKLERNSYDYEDEYNYMLSVEKDFRPSLRITDAMAESLAEILAQLLSQNLPLTIAYKKDDKLIIYPASPSTSE